MNSHPPLQDFADHADSVFWVVAGGAFLVYVSPAFQRIWARPVESVLGSLEALVDTLHPQDAPHVRAWLQAGTDAGDRRSVEYRIHRPDGGVRWIRTRSFPLAPGPGGERRSAGLSDDITVARERRMALEETTRRLTRTFESLHEAVFIVEGADRTILECNGAAVRMFGFTREELLGASTRLLHVSEESFREFGAISVRDLQAGGICRIEFAMRRKDGTTFESEHTVSLLNPEDGVADGVVSVVRDLSGEKDLQRRLQRAQRLEAVGRLAGAVAHDFNNLLTVIRGNVELLEEAPILPSELRPLLHDIRDAARRGSAVTGQLLAFSRRQVMEPRPMDLVEALRGMERLLRRLMGEDVAVRLELPAGPAAVEVDQNHLEQAILNLAMNAREAMPVGGRFTLKLRREEALGSGDRSRFPEASDGPHVLLEVEDTGRGMDRETLDRIFEPFFTTRARQGGTGLGLPSVYGTVNQSGGSIAVESEPGKGTRFLLLFPASPGEPVRRPPPTPDRGEARGRGERILVVEDDPAVRRALTRILARAGYRVQARGSAEEALGWLDSMGDPPDLCLTDVVLPGASGLRLAEILQELRPELPVLLVSGYSEERVGATGGGPGSLPFLAKPFSPLEVTSRVRELLDRRGGNSPRGGPAVG